MKTLKLLPAALLISFSAFAQNSNLDFKYAIKGYNHTTLSKITQSDPRSVFNSSYLNLFNPTIGLQWQTKQDNAHELFLSSVNSHIAESNLAELDTTIYNEANNGFEISLGYEYSLLFNKSKETKFVPSVGLGINPYFNYYQFKNNSLNFQSNGSNTIAGSYFLITPKLLYFFSPKFFGDINIPFYLANVRHYSHKEIRNPSGDFDFNSKSTDIEAFPKVYNLRIGIGLKL